MQGGGLWRVRLGLGRLPPEVDMTLTPRRTPPQRPQVAAQKLPAVKKSAPHLPQAACCAHE